jgi:NhaP-type Na+/H+ or K+/H+ antiporter
VLASDVQVADASDRDRLRFSLTGEAGLNDGTALPFVVLGLGLLGLHDLGNGGLRWVIVDVIWSIGGGLLIGGVLGTLAGRLVIYLRQEHKEAVGLDDFLALGLLGLAYGLALLARVDGFVSVFAAGVALRRVEYKASGGRPPDDVKAMVKVGEEEEVATDAQKAPSYMAEAVLGFNEQLERIAEVTIVMLIGTMLGVYGLAREAIWFVPLMFLVIRPISVALALIGSSTLPSQRWLMSWFGVRGIGSLFYLTYAIEHGVEGELAQRLTALTLTVIGVSIVAHGISVTPLMRLYARENPAEAGGRP